MAGRLFILLYFVTLILLYGSGLHWLIKIGLTLLLLKQPRLDKLSRIGVTANYWIIELSSGDQLVFNEARVLVDTELFLLIVFQSAEERRQFMIFSDQLTKKEHSLLRITEKQKTDMHLQEKAVIE